MKLWKHLIAERDWGFSVQSTLNPKVWKGMEIASSIRPKLMEIVKDFLDEDSKLITIKDVTLTGSLANYNWSEHSDIDLHIIADFGEDAELKKKLFDYKRKIWNNLHEVKIEGFDVEVYVEQHGEPHHSSGVYSVLRGKWIVEPKMEKKHVDLDAVEKKANCLADGIGHVKELIDDANFKQAIDAADAIMRKLKKQRKAGLSSGGEFSIENLAFKLLRRRGDIGKLLDLRKEAYDCSKSINKASCE
jgi:predicted nucleotidyltransferase